MNEMISTNGKEIKPGYGLDVESLLAMKFDQDLLNRAGLNNGVNQDTGLGGPETTPSGPTVN